MEQRTNLLSLTQAELVEFFASIGEPAYRARQVFAGLHQRRLQSLAAMTDLPKGLRGNSIQRQRLPLLLLNRAMFQKTERAAF